MGVSSWKRSKKGVRNLKKHWQKCGNSWLRFSPAFANRNTDVVLPIVSACSQTCLPAHPNCLNTLDLPESDCFNVEHLANDPGCLPKEAVGGTFESNFLPVSKSP